MFPIESTPRNCKVISLQGRLYQSNVLCCCALMEQMGFRAWMCQKRTHCCRYFTQLNRGNTNLPNTNSKKVNFIRIFLSSTDNTYWPAMVKAYLKSWLHSGQTALSLLLRWLRWFISMKWKPYCIMYIVRYLVCVKPLV